VEDSFFDRLKSAQNLNQEFDEKDHSFPFCGGTANGTGKYLPDAFSRGYTKPAEQDAVVDLSHQQPFAPDRYYICTIRDRKSLSIAIEGRPSCGYMRLNSGESQRNPSSTIVRTARSG
jgi:hypothetical protein